MSPLRMRQGLNRRGSERMSEGTNECCREQISRLHAWNWAAGNEVKATPHPPTPTPPCRVAWKERQVSGDQNLPVQGLCQREAERSRDALRLAPLRKGLQPAWKGTESKQGRGAPCFSPRRQLAEARVGAPGGKGRRGRARPLRHGTTRAWSSTRRAGGGGGGVAPGRPGHQGDNEMERNEAGPGLKPGVAGPAGGAAGPSGVTALAFRRAPGGQRLP